MKVFAHGCNINFQESVREMFVPDLKRLFEKALAESDQLLFGKIDLEKQEIIVYGRLKEIVFSEGKNDFVFTYQLQNCPENKEERQKLEELYLSHEACFDIVDEKRGTIPYRVLYVTFMNENSGDETTYFVADERGGSQPLACVAEFWQQVYELGRDIDFEMFGCTAHDLNRYSNRFE
ncbi:hypothetical protein [Thermoactinomyces mirandus]|uniref:Uncharacterized protein n=1 Tax=Thermoactinomyces mirandus TaxID=2756294 RepID=A0A7W2APW0_9BACL|nr:hypothetical protein [Thermoactinomyces mirandus]MBA4601369.1 hypothetical protein [Thermoactinomyces mirandus]